jgi:hypothetical protein
MLRTAPPGSAGGYEVNSASPLFDDTAVSAVWMAGAYSGDGNFLHFRFLAYCWYLSSLWKARGRVWDGTSEDRRGTQWLKMRYADDGFELLRVAREMLVERCDPGAWVSCGMSARDVEG